MGKFMDLVGQSFGRLRVVSLNVEMTARRRVWDCTCECGGSKQANTYDLRAGLVKSCGCLHRERAATLNRTHGLSGKNGESTRTFRIWCGIKTRCLNPNATGYANYGGRGIRLAPEWESYEVFLRDLGPCPEGFSIERKNNDGNYEPANCVWADSSVQSRNTSRSRYVVVGGVKRLARDVAKENGVQVGTFKSRLYKHRWTLEAACLTPAQTYGQAK